MKALYISFRLAGTDGVSLETAKMARVLEELGYDTIYCAGEINPTEGSRHIVIPELHLQDPVALQLGRRMFQSQDPDPSLAADLRRRADELTAKLMSAVHTSQPDLLVIQNVWAIPLNLPFAAALAAVVTRTGLPTLSHEHDYHWERIRFSQPLLPDYLETYFPFHAPNVSHLSINQPAAAELRQRRGFTATVLPNVIDFDQTPPRLDAYNQDFRAAIGLTDRDIIFLQPTRVVPRKGIELAIDLLAARHNPRDVLVISHDSGDEGHDYLEMLQLDAKRRHVRLLHTGHTVGDQRSTHRGRKIYSLWDVYPHANFVTYPSLYEGFGNALLEAVYCRQPVFLNRYAIYRSDIAPVGMEFVEIEGQVTSAAVAEVDHILASPERRQRLTEHNFQLARKHFSYDTLRRILQAEIASLRPSIAPTRPTTSAAIN